MEWVSNCYKFKSRWLKCTLQVLNRLREERGSTYTVHLAYFDECYKFECLHKDGNIAVKAKLCKSSEVRDSANEQHCTSTAPALHQPCTSTAPALHQPCNRNFARRSEHFELHSERVYYGSTQCLIQLFISFLYLYFRPHVGHITGCVP